MATFLEGIEIGMAGDATAIGSALGTAVKRLRDSQADSKVIILLTDGRSNAGALSPQKAAEIAETFGIKVYTVGVGTKGRAPMPVSDPIFGKRLISVDVDLDEETLTKIAEITDGRYFRATDRDELVEIYEQIDEMEKTRVEQQTFVNYTDKYLWFVLPALGIFFLELGLGHSVLREVP